MCFCRCHLTHAHQHAPEIGNGIRLYGFSGLYAIDSSGTRFFTVTDRGPNLTETVAGEDRVTFPLPQFSPSILRLERRGDQLRIVRVIQLAPEHAGLG